MVGGRVGKIVLILFLVAVGVALSAATLLPSASDHPGEHCAALLIKSAMAAYLEAEGHLEKDFRAYADHLRAPRRAPATIRKVSGDKYEIHVCCAGYNFRVVIDYRMDSKGLLEVYDVLDIDRLGKCPPIDSASSSK